MDVSKLCDLELRYTSLESLDYEPGGQLYGTMEGSLTGKRLSGTVHLTNLAARRPRQRQPPDAPRRADDA